MLACLLACHTGQLSLVLLRSAGREINTDHSALMLCICGIKADVAHSICGKTCG